MQDVNSAPIPSNLADRPASRINMKFVAGGLLIMLFVGYLATQMVQATMSTGAYYLTVAEVYGRGAEAYGQRIRVNGNVVEGSEDWNAKEITLKFAIADESGEQLPIVFYGPRPDNFQRAASAIIEGEMLPDGSFQAETLLLKCPSRYEEEPEEIYAEAQRG